MALVLEKHAQAVSGRALADCDIVSPIVVQIADSNGMIVVTRRVDHVGFEQVRGIRGSGFASQRRPLGRWLEKATRFCDHSPVGIFSGRRFTRLERRPRHAHGEDYEHEGLAHLH